MSRIFFAGVLVWTVSAGGLTFEAANAPVKTTGERIPGGWRLGSPGMVGACVRIRATGMYEVTVRASGSPLQGIWPVMALTVDDLVRERLTVDRTDFTKYLFPIRLYPGIHVVGVTLANDAGEQGEARSLCLDKIEVRAAPGGKEPALVRAGKRLTKAPARLKAARQREEAILRETGPAIRQNRMGPATVTVLDRDGHPLEGASVCLEQTRHDFLFGCNIMMFDGFKTAEENAAYKQQFQDLFNYATTAFYWRSYESEKGKPRYPETDKVVDWCRRRGIRIKGHPLLWEHEAGIPTWSNGLPAPEIQRNRVEEILRRYEGRIESWEVVNEPAHYPGTPIDGPYRWARAVSPDAYLIVNDFMVMFNGYPAFHDLLEQAKRRGIPFNGIGIQAHAPADTAFPLDRVQSILDWYATLGREIHITEFTPCSNGRKVLGASWRGRWDEAQQADYAEKFYRVCFAHPGVAAITWWDLCDRASWLEQGGMLRKDLSPKPVYEALKRLIHEEWRTRVEGRTDKSGTLPFSGFYGLYRVAARWDGLTAETEAHLMKNAPNQFTITLPGNAR
jgi:GH35 family endo-1,4-beta-xylanase